VEHPEERLRTALEELYAHYRRTERMRQNVLRDEASMPIIAKTLSAYRTYLAAAEDVLMDGRRVRGGAAKRVRAAVGHSLAFATWRSLAREQSLDDPQAADLMCRLVASAAVSRERGGT
jgi:hypothetical protein